jgi:hypothetical protein
VISAKEPLVYLRERAEANSLGIDDLRRRLRSHLIPANFADQGGYSELEVGKRNQQIQSDYNTFLLSRAELVLKYAKQLCDGREPQV